jgi:hypothetical protein
MPLTNAEKQARWRDRNMIVLSASAEHIASKLTATDDLHKLHKLAALLNHHLKDQSCPTCNGKGLYRMQRWPSCSVSRKRRAEPRPLETTDPFPCPTCRPAEYFIASGGELRNQGRHVEAIIAALKVMDNWSIGDAMLAWGVSPKEAQAALDEAGIHITQTDLARVRDIAKGVAPDNRRASWGLYNEIGWDRERQKLVAASKRRAAQRAG